MPVISVIMGVYNNEGTIQAAMGSILDQTFQDWECIVCDDASDDGTWDKINEFAVRNERFIVIRNEQNRGPAFTRNRCIEKARGKYIAIQDGDDISMPGRLGALAKTLDQREEISAVGSYARLFDNTGHTWGELRTAINPETAAWLDGCQIIHASVMFRKKELVESGGYDDTLRKAEDYDLFARLVVRGGRVTSIPEFLYAVRWDASNYARKGPASRWQEAMVKLRIARMITGRWYSFLYMAKPLLLGFVPPSLLFRYHRKILSTINKNQ